MGSEWREVRLGELANEITVGHVGSMPTYVDDGIPFLRSQNVDRLRINDSDIKTIDSVSHDRLRKSTLHPGDVVIVRTGRPGACAVIPPSLPVANCSDLVIVRCGPALDPWFLAYYINSAAVHGVSSQIVGAVQQHFNIGSARDLTIRLPDLATQREVVEILRALDDKIELNRCMSQTLESIARALFKSWFVDFDPVRAKSEVRDHGLPTDVAELFPDSFCDSEFGEIPRGWGVDSVYRVASVIYGAPFGSAHFNDRHEGVPLIRIRDLETHDPQISTLETHPRGYLVEPGDLVVGMDGEFRAHQWQGPSAWLNQRLCCFRPKSGVSRAFVHYSIDTLLEFFERSKTGTTVIHLGKSDIDTFRILVPPSSVLRAFGLASDRLDQLVVCLSQETRTLVALRNDLLPRLVSAVPPRSLISLSRDSLADQLGRSA